jgi:hypothetical protein
MKREGQTHLALEPIPLATVRNIACQKLTIVRYFISPKIFLVQT